MAGAKRGKRAGPAHFGGSPTSLSPHVVHGAQTNESTRCNDQWNGARGIRTPDLLHAMQTRSQLRHGPDEPGIINNSAVHATPPGPHPEMPSNAGWDRRGRKKLGNLRLLVDRRLIGARRQRLER